MIFSLIKLFKLNKYERVLNMFMGGTTEQWIGVIEWLFLMVILFTGTFVVSCIITNKFLHKKRKNNLLY